MSLLALFGIASIAALCGVVIKDAVKAIFPRMLKKDLPKLTPGDILDALPMPAGTALSRWEGRPCYRDINPLNGLSIDAKRVAAIVTAMSTESLDMRRILLATALGMSEKRYHAALVDLYREDVLETKWVIEG